MVRIMKSSGVASPETVAHAHTLIMQVARQVVWSALVPATAREVRNGVILRVLGRLGAPWSPVEQIAEETLMLVWRWAAYSEDLHSTKLGFTLAELDTALDRVLLPLSDPGIPIEWAAAYLATDQL